MVQKRPLMISAQAKQKLKNALPIRYINYRKYWTFQWKTLIEDTMEYRSDFETFKSMYATHYTIQVILTSSSIRWNQTTSASCIKRNGITLDMIYKAIIELYGDTAVISDVARKFIEDALYSDEYERVYNEIRENEKHSKNILLEFNEDHPEVLNEDNIDSILEQAKRKLKDGE